MPNELHTMPLKLEALFSSQKFRAMHWIDKGAFLLLLAEGWLKAGLIDDPETFIKDTLTNATQDDLDRVKGNVFDKMYKKGLSGKYFNEMQLDIYNKTLAKIDKFKESGRKGGLRQAQARLKAGSSIQIQNQIQNQTTIGSKAFTPPTLQEVQNYSKEINYDLDCQKFIDFYQSKGWMVGKNKMKDWKASVRTWKGKTESPAGKFAVGQKHEQELRAWKTQ